MKRIKQRKDLDDEYVLVCDEPPKRYDYYNERQAKDIEGSLIRLFVIAAVLLGLLFTSAEVLVPVALLAIGLLLWRSDENQM